MQSPNSHQEVPDNGNSPSTSPPAKLIIHHALLTDPDPVYPQAARIGEASRSSRSPAAAILGKMRGEMDETPQGAQSRSPDAVRQGMSPPVAAANSSQAGLLLPLRFNDSSQNPHPSEGSSQGRMPVKEQSLPDGTTYTGQWNGTAPDGQGVQSWPDEGRYEGQFRSGRLEGNGKFIYPNGDVYTGPWLNGQPHGEGAETRPDGTTFVGQYKVGFKTGLGKFTWTGSKEGASYSGGFLEDEFSGQGTFTWIDGRKYEGQWNKGKMHGTGTFDFSDGRKYVGQYVDERRSGNGRFSWPDNRIYDGQFYMGKQHGNGTYTDTSGLTRKGEWENGKRLRWQSDTERAV